MVWHLVSMLEVMHLQKLSVKYGEKSKHVGDAASAAMGN